MKKNHTRNIRKKFSGIQDKYYFVVKMNFIRSSSVFSPSGVTSQKKKATLAPTSFGSKTVVYTIPQSATESQKLALGMLYIFCGTSTEGGLGKWKTWVASYVCLVTPSFSGQLASESFLETRLSEALMANLEAMMMDFMHYLENGDVDNADLAADVIKGQTLLPGLPAIPADADLLQSAGEWDGKVILCHYSVMLFLAGKRLDGPDHSQATVKRPEALRGKTHIGEPLETLEGVLRMSDESHVSINNAWSEMSQLRSLVFSEYAKYDSDQTDMAKDIIWTTMHLLRFSNMAHATITYNFLCAYPWADEVPALRTSIGVYAESVKMAARCDPHILPFLKLIYGDKSGLFPRKEMEPLIACAKDVLKDTSRTLDDFYSDASFNPVIEAFRNEMERRESIRAGKILREEKDLKDYLGIPEESQSTAPQAPIPEAPAAETAQTT